MRCGDFGRSTRRPRILPSRSATLIQQGRLRVMSPLLCALSSGRDIRIDAQWKEEWSGVTLESWTCNPGSYLGNVRRWGASHSGDGRDDWRGALAWSGFLSGRETDSWEMEDCDCSVRRTAVPACSFLAIGALTAKTTCNLGGFLTHIDLFFHAVLLFVSLLTLLSMRRAARKTTQPVSILVFGHPSWAAGSFQAPLLPLQEPACFTSTSRQFSIALRERPCADAKATP